MNSEFFLWQLAKQRQAEVLKQAEINRQLKEARIRSPRSLKREILIALCCTIPVVLIIVQGVALAAGGGGGGGIVHLMM